MVAFGGLLAIRLDHMSTRGGTNCYYWKNHALLGKWLWCIGEEGYLRRRVVGINMGKLGVNASMDYVGIKKYTWVQSLA